MNYDFLILSPFEFENLSRDLIQKKLNVFLESFGPGQDQGIDFRCSNTENIIVQAKRYKDYKSLISELKKETKKVKLLNPSRYILSTSVSLNPNQKSIIKELFRPYILFDDDILAKEDLNNLLVEYPEVEKVHYKLWLSSVSILQEIFNKQVINQSKFVQDEIKEKLKIYVENSEFFKASNILRENNYVIISGNAGIGKTTLAEILVFRFLAKGVEEFVFLSDSISKAFEFYDETKSQIFLFDDFLGRNFLKNKLPTNEENQILRFIKRIEKSKNKLLIFTTREYILNQAKIDFEEFNRFNFSKCIIDLNEYSQFTKAKILYNHFHVYEIPYPYVEELRNTQILSKLINHRNYNPRLIDAVTKKKLWNSHTPSEFSNKILHYFEHPFEIWEHIFETQISKISQIVLLSLVTTNNRVDYEALLKQVQIFLKMNSNYSNISISAISYKQSLKELENSFIKINTNYEDNLIIQFINPSIYDFLVSYINGSTALKNELLKSIHYIGYNLEVYSNNKLKENKRGKIIYSHDQKLILHNTIKSNFERIEYKSRNTKYSKPNESDEVILKLDCIQTFLPDFDNSFIISSLQLSISPLNITFHSFIQFTRLFAKYSNHIKLNEKTLFEDILFAIDDVESLQSLEVLKTHYPDEFVKFSEEFEDDLDDTFSTIVNSIIAEEFEEIEEYEKSIVLLEYIEDTFGHDVYDAKNEVEQHIENIKKKQEKEEQDESLQRTYYLQHHDRELRNRVSATMDIPTSNESISNLFSSLK